MACVAILHKLAVPSTSSGGTHMTRLTKPSLLTRELLDVAFAVVLAGGLTGPIITASEDWVAVAVVVI